MTDPNSASPQPNSASVHPLDRMLQFIVFVVFWVTVVGTANDIAMAVNHMDLPSLPNSAFLYMWWGFILLMSFRGWLGTFVPLMLAGFACSVVLLNWDCWAFQIAKDVVVMCAAYSSVDGHVWPWNVNK